MRQMGTVAASSRCRPARGAAGQHAEVPARRGLQRHRARVGHELAEVMARRPPARSRPRGPPRRAAARRASARSMRAVASARAAPREVVGAEEAVVQLAEGAPGVGVHAAMKASTASIWASSSRSCEVGGDRPRLHQVLVDAGHLVAAAHQRRGRAAEQAVELGDPRPRVTAAIGRSGAIIGTLEKSNGLATSAIESIGRSRSSACGEQRHDPAEAPGDDPHRAVAGVLGGGAHGAGITSSIQCSRPSARSAKSISP